MNSPTAAASLATTDSELWQWTKSLPVSTNETRHEWRHNKRKVGSFRTRRNALSQVMSAKFSGHVDTKLYRRHGVKGQDDRTVRVRPYWTVPSVITYAYGACTVKIQLHFVELVTFTVSYWSLYARINDTFSTRGINPAGDRGTRPPTKTWNGWTRHVPPNMAHICFSFSWPVII